MNTEHWGIKQVISCTMLSLITVILLLVGSMICMVNSYALIYLSGALGVLLAAPLYLLMEYKVDRFGSFTVLMAIMSLMFLLQDVHFWVFIPIYSVVGFILEYLLLRKPGVRKDIKRLSLCWMVFSALYLLSTYIPLMVDYEGYMSSFKERFNDPEAISIFVFAFSDPIQVLFILVLTVLFAALGCYVGSRMLSRHFTKTQALS